MGGLTILGSEVPGVLAGCDEDVLVVGLAWSFFSMASSFFIR